MRRQWLAGGLLPVLLAAGCTGPASDPAAAPSATPSLALLDQGIRWARCLRENGVPQPDPQVVNGDGIRFEGLSKDSVDPAALQRAQAACEAYRPVLPADVQAFKLGLARQTARCMREHGVENFPDPEPDGHFDVGPAVDSNPAFPAAKQLCDAQEAAAAASAGPHR